MKTHEASEFYRTTRIDPKQKRVENISDFKSIRQEIFASADKFSRQIIDSQENYDYERGLAETFSEQEQTSSQINPEKLYNFCGQSLELAGRVFHFLNVAREQKKNEREESEKEFYEEQSRRNREGVIKRYH